uniref:Uncharacterized protein n=1 Tax=Bionectria ochroleuca TaxID=29856 RepID=A0A8H7NFU3_BIOOC
MNSTPRTPAASKFLLPKRSTQSSQAPRFQPTPRFASSGTRATQASRSIEDVDENDLGGFSGPGSSSVDDDHESLGELEVTQEELPRRTRGNMSLEESIEVESVLPSDSLIHESSQDEVAQSSWRYNSIDEDLEEPMPSSPLAKRRKISISPLPTSSPQASDHLGEDLFQEKLQQVIEDNSPQSDFAGDHGSDGSPDLSDLETAMQSHGPQQPTFRAPLASSLLKPTCQSRNCLIFFRHDAADRSMFPGIGCRAARVAFRGSRGGRQGRQCRVYISHQGGRTAPRERHEPCSGNQTQ